MRSDYLDMREIRCIIFNVPVAKKRFAIIFNVYFTHGGENMYTIT